MVTVARKPFQVEVFQCSNRVYCRNFILFNTKALQVTSDYSIVKIDGLFDN